MNIEIKPQILTHSVRSNPISVKPAEDDEDMKLLMSWAN